MTRGQSAPKAAAALSRACNSAAWLASRNLISAPQAGQRSFMGDRFPFSVFRLL